MRWTAKALLLSLLSEIVYPEPQPVHIVVLLLTALSSVERHIRGGKCKEFNPDLPVCTLLCHP